MKFLWPQPTHPSSEDAAAAATEPDWGPSHKFPPRLHRVIFVPLSPIPRCLVNFRRFLVFVVAFYFGQLHIGGAASTVIFISVPSIEVELSFFSNSLPCSLALPLRPRVGELLIAAP